MNRLVIAAAVLVLIAGCASKGPASDVPVENRDTASAGANTGTALPNTQTQGMKDNPVIGNTLKSDPLKDAANILSKRVIYFDYDKDSVRPEFAPVLQAHAKFLTENRARKIRLEGHADERGSREYNMALGQRRAEAVRKAASVLGVSVDRIETISFGEDKPRANGHDESAWAQNRRVEIVYDGE